MFVRLLVLFIVIPLAEIFLLFRLYDGTQYVLGQTSAETGSIPMYSTLVTIGIILFTGFLGAWLAKQQGLGTIRRIQKSIAEGRLPTTELVDGGMILFAAALLLTPGILTDAFGFSLLTPVCRGVYRKLLKRWFPKNMVSFTSAGPSPFGFGTNRDAEDGDVVDGTARNVGDGSLSDQ